MKAKVGKVLSVQNPDKIFLNKIIGRVKYAIILVLLFVSFSSSSARYKITDLDSLKKVSLKLQGKEKVQCLNRISELYWSVNLDSSIYYANQSLKLAKKILDKKGMAFAYNNLGGAYFYRNDYYNAIKNFNFSFELRKELDDKKSQSAVLSNMCAIYINMGIFDKALEYNSKVLELSKEIDDKEGIASVYVTNALIFSEWGMKEKSIKMYLKGIKLLREINNLTYLTSVIGNLSYVYFSLGENEKGLKCINEAKVLAESTKNLFASAQISSILGGYYAKQKEYDSAIVFYHKAITIYEKFQKEEKADIFGSLADVYLEMGIYDSVSYYLDLALKSSVKTNQFTIIQEIYNIYTKFYEKTNNPEKALKYYRLYTEIKDSIQSDKSRSKLMDMQIRIETEKLNAEKIIQDLKIKRNKNQRNIAIILAISILIISIVLYSRFVLKTKTNRVLSAKNDELQIANTTKDKFFTIISHDLKNQLTAFQTISQVLAESFQQISEEKKHHLIIRISNSAKTLNEVLENLLTWSYAQLKGIDFEPKQINLFELTNRTLNELNLAAEKKEIQLVNEVPDNISVWADENMVMNILRNLINNSIKFSSEKTLVRVTVILNDQMAKISVIDQGLGLSISDQEKLFRIDVNHKEIGSGKEKGSGLGLIISKEFVKKMGGKIWVESSEGKGSTFNFSLPLKN